MAWDVVLESANRELVKRLGTHSALDRHWTPNEIAAYPWLTSIDPYAENVFNFRQIQHLLSELDRLIREVDDDGTKRELVQLKGWLEAVPDAHLYLRMSGD